MSPLPTLLLIRPARQSRRLLATCEEGLRQPVPAIISPVMRIEGTGNAPDPADFDGVIVTSVNAVEQGPPLAGRAAWCVGERTAQAARAAGARVMLTAVNAEHLVRDLSAPGARLLWLRGVEAARDLQAALASVGLDVTPAIVYRQVPQDISQDMRDAISGHAPAVLPLYSPKSAAWLGRQVARVGREVRVIALSPAVARAWTDETGGQAEICSSPRGDEMTRRIVAALRHGCA